MSEAEKMRLNLEMLEPIEGGLVHVQLATIPGRSR